MLDGPFYMVTMNVIYLGTVLQIWFLCFVRVMLGMNRFAGYLDGGLLYATDDSFVRGTRLVLDYSPQRTALPINML